MAKGIQRRELKEPDEFLTLSKRFLDYARQHEREVTLAVLALIALTAVALGVRWYRSWQESNAEAAFGAARRDYTAQKFEAAAQGFHEVGTTWPGTAYGQLALVYVGNCYAELGKTKEAKDAFTQALGRGGDPMVRQIAHYNLGVLKAKDGDKAGAANELGSATDIEGPLRGAAWFARLSTAEQFVEDVGQGMQAIEELSPEARQYVEAQIAQRAKSGGK
jgi:predicted negative regulator of RcsB-dependent stress response